MTAPRSFLVCHLPTALRWPCSFVPCTSDNLFNVLNCEVNNVRHLYYIEAGDIRHLRESSTTAGRVATVSAYIWKLFAGIVEDEGDTCCRMVRAPRSWGATVCRKSLGWCRRRYVRRRRRSVSKKWWDWMEEHKREGEMGGEGKCPAMVLTSFHNFGVDLDFGLGRPVLVMPVVPKGRLCSAFLQVVGESQGRRLLVRSWLKRWSWMVSSSPSLLSILVWSPPRLLVLLANSKIRRSHVQ
ncbi:hypothetical protein GW17_00001125 [Ensete ventricosum]|nr:hypothetical protein GW17_00001125 [Ensete ventricosum]